MLHGRRKRDPAGPPIGTDEEGHADFGPLRVWLHCASDADDPRAGDTFWQVGHVYRRADAEDPWVEIPHMLYDPGSLIWGSPLWMAHALRGVSHSTRIAEEVVQGVPAERFALTIDVARAQRGDGISLHVPPLAATEFRAQVWLDADGLVRRVSGAWPTRFSRIPGLGRLTWVQTEFWDFGVSVDGLEVP